MIFNEISLKDAVEFVVDNRGKTVPVQSSGIPLIATNCINNINLYPQYINLRYVSDKTYDSWFRAHPQPDDIILTNKGSKNGAICLVPQPVSFCIAQDMVALRAKKGVVYPRYLFAVLRSKIAQDRIKNLNVDSVIPHFKKTDFDKLYFPLPDYNTQIQIGDYYFNFCRKIEMNSQTNQTLEEIVQAIFKSWFVDFDPVKAKMRSEQPEGMDAVTASLFPENLVESELGLIPEGWEAVKIEGIIQRLKPKKRYTKKQVEPYGKTPVYEQGASVLLGFHNDDAGFDATPENPVFIFGDHTCITYLSCSKFDISSNVIPLKGAIRPTIWTYYAIQGKQEFQEYRRHWSELIVKNVILPSLELTEKFAELVTTQYLMIESLKRQSIELEQVRDALLPKLLSGEIEL